MNLEAVQQIEEMPLQALPEVPQAIIGLGTTGVRELTASTHQPEPGEKPEDDPRPGLGKPAPGSKEAEEERKEREAVDPDKPFGTLLEAA